MSTSTSADLAVVVTGMTKSFGPTRALDGAGLTLRRGTVHALLGGNGSGKSTAIKVLAGVHPGDAGHLVVNGREADVAGWSAADAAEAGLRFVHQDLGLFEQLSIAENVALAAGYPTRVGRSVRWKELRAHVAELLERFEIDARPEQPVGSLRPAQRTMVAIARALQDRDDGEAVLVLDEPTATLPAHESEALLAAIRRRADLGQTVMMVSHRMQEVLAVADDFTVFLDGRSVAHLVGGTDAGAPTEAELVAHMTGRAFDGEAGRERVAVPQQAGEAALVVDDLHGGPLRGVSLSAWPGEIVGVAGLVGSGRSALLTTIFGVHRPSGGVLRVLGREQTGREDVKARMRQGVAYVSEDRVGESAFANLSLRENLSASVLRSFWGWRGMATTAERRSAEELVVSHAVKAGSVDHDFATLSGGNQQKAVVGRWLRRTPRLLLLDEPTQGVDVMSRVDIYATVRAAAADGCTVLVASSDFFELSTLCDRVVVLRDGVVDSELTGDELTPDHLTAATQSSVLTAGDAR